ncbi:MAG: hypothetical protein ABI599_14200 [Flavobacteriales bacterium]
MGRLIIDIFDPKKEKEVAEILLSIGGVVIERVEPTPKKTPNGKRAIKRNLTAREEKFVKELRQSLKEAKDHLSGKKKFRSAREFLHEL